MVSQQGTCFLGALALGHTGFRAFWIPRRDTGETTGLHTRKTWEGQRGACCLLVSHKFAMFPGRDGFAAGTQTAFPGRDRGSLVSRPCRALSRWLCDDCVN